MKREELPFRKNCEGFFISADGKVLAKKASFGIMFPGGGVDEGESIEEAILREAREETGAIIEKLEFLEKLTFIWDENWATTQKQKKRYELYQGEEMHFFKGKIKLFDQITQYEDSWKEPVLMSVEKAFELLEKKKENDSSEYTKKQIELLKKVIENI